MKHPLGKRFADLPSFGLLFALVFAPLACFQMTWFSFPHFGFMVHAVKDISVLKPLPGSELLVVQVDAKGRFYLNSKPVQREDLTAALQDALRQRFNRVVAVEGDPNAEYQSVVFAIDAIRGAQAQVVLVTSPQKP